jgi:hypothetical protein
MSQRRITLNWTATTDPAVVGYNVYLVSGAPALTTRSLIAYLPSNTTDSYDYTLPDETQQYQFEVRSTTAQVSGTESDPLEIFYPDGRATYSPTLLTPDGKPMMIVRDAQYITSAEFFNYANGMKLNLNSPIYTSGTLDIYLKAASAQVNRICRRHFDVQTIDEVYHNVRVGTDYPKLITIFLREKPIQNIVSLNIQVLKYFIPVALDYLQLDQTAGFYHIVPLLGAGASAVPLPSAVLIDGMLGKMWTRYTFGYDVMPEEVKIATSLIATKLITLGSQNPLSAQSVKFGRNFSLQWNTDTDPIMNMVKDMLRPYLNYSFGRSTNPM